MNIKLTLVYLTLVSGCAVHLRAPEPDLRDQAPLRPSAQPSNIAAVARIPYATVAALVEAQLPAKLAGTEKLGMVDATWQVWRDGAVGAHADQRGRLCFDVPFGGKGEMAAFGQRLDRELRAQIQVCAQPVLDGQAVLRLKEVDARVLIDRNSLGGPLQLLLDAVAGRLQQVASEDLTRRIQDLSVPTPDALAPVQATIRKPIDLGQTSCLKLRPQQAWLAQPGIDPTALRIGAAVQALPTVERPCTAQDSSGAGRLAVGVVPHLEQPKTALWLPMATGIEVIEEQVQNAVTAMGRIDTPQGWLQVGKVKLSTSRGNLLVRAAIDGQVRDSVLFIPIQRRVKGEVLLWGVPKVDASGVHMDDLQLDLQSDDALVDWVASLKRSDLVKIVASKLAIKKEKIDADAQRALASLGQGVVVSGVRLPVRVDTELLELQQVSAVGQRLEVLVHFVGQVVVGDTNAR